MAKKRIPPELKATLETQERMYRCLIANEECDGRIHWHHAVQWQGQSLQVDWAIHGMCAYHHDLADRPDIRAVLVKAMHKLGGDQVKNYETIKKL